MTDNRIMRLLRLKHCISATKLGQAVHVSRQRILQIELSQQSTTEYQRELVHEAFAIIAQKNNNTALRRDLRKLEYRLLDFAREDDII